MELQIKESSLKNEIISLQEKLNSKKPEPTAKINENLLEGGRINSDIYKPLGRGAGNNWIKCDHTFQLDRQTRNQIQWV